MLKEQRSGVAKVVGQRQRARIWARSPDDQLGASLQAGLIGGCRG